MFEIVAAVTDVAILGWLVFTWFHEGSHKKCKVMVACPRCGEGIEQPCQADHRNLKDSAK